MDGGNIAGHAHQRIMTTHQCFVAELQTLVEDLPEYVLIAMCDDTHLGQVQGYNTLIETSLELVVAICILPGREEAPAAHG